MITPKNIIRHELIGLHAAVAKSSNRSCIGISGKVVNETKNLITIKTEKGEKKIQKENTEFIFMLPSGAKVKVDGSQLAVKPEDRIKLKTKKW